MSGQLQHPKYSHQAKDLRDKRREERQDQGGWLKCGDVYYLYFSNFSLGSQSFEPEGVPPEFRVLTLPPA